MKRAVGFVLDIRADAQNSLFAFLALGFITAGTARPEGACTAFVMRGGGAVILAKNLDWPVGEGIVFVNKRDVVKEAFGGCRPAAAATALREYRMLGQRPLLDHAFVVLKSVAQEDTQWSVAYNIPRRLVFFKTGEHRRYKIIPLESLDFSCRSPALMLPVTTESAGNLTRNLIPYSPQENRRLLESVFQALRDKGELRDIAPSSVVLEMAAYPELCRCRK